MEMVVMEFVLWMSDVAGEIVEGSFNEQNEWILTLQNDLYVSITTYMLYRKKLLIEVFANFSYFRKGKKCFFKNLKNCLLL